MLYVLRCTCICNLLVEFSHSFGASCFTKYLEISSCFSRYFFGSLWYHLFVDLAVFCIYFCCFLLIFDTRYPYTFKFMQFYIFMCWRSNYLAYWQMVWHLTGSGRIGNNMPTGPVHNSMICILVFILPISGLANWDHNCSLAFTLFWVLEEEKGREIKSLWEKLKESKFFSFLFWVLEGKFNLK